MNKILFSIVLSIFAYNSYACDIPEYKAKVRKLFHNDLDFFTSVKQSKSINETYRYIKEASDGLTSISRSCSRSAYSSAFQNYLREVARLSENVSNDIRTYQHQLQNYGNGVAKNLSSDNYGWANAFGLMTQVAVSSAQLETSEASINRDWELLMKKLNEIN